MNTSLSPELRALCEWASHEQDPKKLLALTKRINELLEQAERKKAPQTERPPAAARIRHLVFVALEGIFQNASRIKICFVSRRVCTV